MDILDAVATARDAFRATGLEPPTVILLGSHDEWMKFLSMVRQQTYWVAEFGGPSLGHVVEMADGSAWMEIELMGMKFRWPANRWAMPDGSWRYA